MPKNWYKKSMEQSTFGFAEDDSTLMQSPQLYHSDKSQETLQDLMDETSGYLGVESNLIKFKYKWEMFKFPSGDRVIVVNIDGDKYVIDDFINPDVEEATRWLWKLSEGQLMSFYPAELRNAVAHKIGLNTFEAEVEAGITPTTVICRVAIPPK